jgi:hypothetical protein
LIIAREKGLGEIYKVQQIMKRDERREKRVRRMQRYILLNLDACKPGAGLYPHGGTAASGIPNCLL